MTEAESAKIEAAKEIKQRIKTQIDNADDPFARGYINYLRVSGKIANEDAIETEGFVKGLKVANEIINEYINSIGSVDNEEEEKEPFGSGA